MWRVQGKITDEHSSLLGNMFKSVAPSTESGADGRRGSILRSIFTWIFRLVFASAVGLFVYIAVFVVDWSQPLSSQVDQIKDSLLNKLDMLEAYIKHSPDDSVVGASWSSVPSPERVRIPYSGVTQNSFLAKRSPSRSPDRSLSSRNVEIRIPDQDPNFAGRRMAPQFIPSE